MNAPSLTRQHTVWVPAGIALVWLVLLVLYWNYTMDDAYIIFRYAVHFAKGVGLIYNPSTVVDGYTSFLWTVIIGSAVFLFGESQIVGITKLVSGVLSALTLLFTYQMAQRAPETRSSGWVAVALTSVTPAFIISTVDGLETPLYMAIQMLLMLQWMRDLDRGALSPMYGVWAALLCLARPDGALFVGLATFLFFRFCPLSQEALIRSLYAVVAWSALFVPYFVWHWFYYGHPLPNTFYAKMGGEWELFLRGIYRLLKWHLELGSLLSVVFVFYAVLKRSSPYTTILVAAIVSRVILVLWSGGEAMGHHRFMAPAVPVYWLLFHLGLCAWLSHSSLQGSWIRKALSASPMILFVLLIGISLSHLPRCQRYAKGLSQAHIRLGQWIDQNTSSNARIAVGDAGAIPYYANRHTIDIMGLNEPYLAHLPGRLGHKIDTEYVLAQKPDIVILLSENPPPLSFRGRTPIDRALYEALEREGSFVLHSVYQFNERYFLWVMVRRTLPKSRAQDCVAPAARSEYAEAHTRRARPMYEEQSPQVGVAAKQGHAPRGAPLQYTVRTLPHRERTTPPRRTEASRARAC